MTMSNNDMVALFPDIVACMEIPVLEIKKMYVEIPRQTCTADIESRCFLYLQHYARTKPDIALRALPVLQEVISPLVNQ
jgi:AP-2 complex subunit beta-1